jgi:hypothetical protein
MLPDTQLLWAVLLTMWGLIAAVNGRLSPAGWCLAISCLMCACSACLSNDVAHLLLCASAASWLAYAAWQVPPQLGASTRASTQWLIFAGLSDCALVAVLSLCQLHRFPRQLAVLAAPDWIQSLPTESQGAGEMLAFWWLIGLSLRLGLVPAVVWIRDWTGSDGSVAGLLLVHFPIWLMAAGRLQPVLVQAPQWHWPALGVGLLTTLMCGLQAGWGVTENPELRQRFRKCALAVGWLATYWIASLSAARPALSLFGSLAFCGLLAIVLADRFPRLASLLIVAPLLMFPAAHQSVLVPGPLPAVAPDEPLSPSSFSQTGTTFPWQLGLLAGQLLLWGSTRQLFASRSDESQTTTPAPFWQELLTGLLLPLLALGLLTPISDWLWWSAAAVAGGWLLALRQLQTVPQQVAEGVTSTGGEESWARLSQQDFYLAELWYRLTVPPLHFFARGLHSGEELVTLSYRWINRTAIDHLDELPLQSDESVQETHWPWWLLLGTLTVMLVAALAR